MSFCPFKREHKIPILSLLIHLLLCFNKDKEHIGLKKNKGKMMTKLDFCLVNEKSLLSPTIYIYMCVCLYMYTVCIVLYGIISINNEPNFF